jgi:hypothetical protein
VEDTRHLGRNQPIVDLSNSQSCELRGVLGLGPSRWSLVEVLTRRSHTHIASQVSEVWRKRSRGDRFTNLRVAEGSCAKAGLWLHGDIRLTPGVDLRKVGFYEGLVD